MPNYFFETQIVFAADNPGIVMTNATVTLYNPSDTALTSPIAVTDTFGLPKANPVQVSPEGFLPALIATIPQIRWVAGGYSGYLNSFQGVLAAAQAAQAAAEAAAAAAGSGLPTGSDGQFLGNVMGTPTWQELTIPTGTGTGRTDYVYQNTTTGVIPARPTSDPAILVFWVCWTEPNRVASGTGGAHPNDIWIKRVAP
jgi:hypothetical protein